MKAIGVSNQYMSGKVFIIWEIPHDKITGYEIYRDNKMIASSFEELESEESETEEKNKTPIFISPTMFDHDHHTNLFRKDSTFKLMYIDEDVHRYQHYEYKVVAIRKNEEGITLETIESDMIRIEAL